MVVNQLLFLNDHATLRRDPLLATACDKLDPLGLDRLTPARCGAALAAAATSSPHAPAAGGPCLLTVGVRGLPKHAREVVLDLDATGRPAGRWAT